MRMHRRRASRPSSSACRADPVRGRAAAIQGIGTFGGFQFMLQDRAATPSATSTAWRTRWWPRATTRQSGLTGLYTTFTAQRSRSCFVTIDREKAKAIGVPLSQITLR